MSSFKITMKDGTVREFKHQSRPGGSYTKTIKYEPGFVIIKDEYDMKISIPTDSIAEIVEVPERSW